MNFTKAIVLILLLILSNPVICQNRYVSYSDLTLSLNPSVLIIDQKAGKILVGHVSRTADFCKKSSFRCVKSTAFSFAVPISKISVGSKWKSDNETYQVVAEKTFELLGSGHRCFLIKRQQDGVFFYYSTNRGLLAFALPNSGIEKLDVFVSSSDKGFLAH